MNRRRFNNITFFPRENIAQGYIAAYSTNTGKGSPVYVGAAQSLPVSVEHKVSRVEMNPNDHASLMAFTETAQFQAMTA